MNAFSLVAFYLLLKHLSTLKTIFSILVDLLSSNLFKARDWGWKCLRVSSFPYIFGTNVFGNKKGWMKNPFPISTYPWHFEMIMSQTSCSSLANGKTGCYWCTMHNLRKFCKQISLLFVSPWNVSQFLDLGFLRVNDTPCVITFEFSKNCNVSIKLRQTGFSQ